MQLIGMLDSPYVRRVAITLLRLGLPFEHRSISVFRGYDEFARINPVVKAPTLVCDDGTVLMDSSLMLDYAEALAAARGTPPAGAGASLMPAAPAPRAQALRRIGLALAACEKSVQLVYERQLRPPEKQHAPWAARVTGQLQAACAALEAEWQARPPAPPTDAPGGLDQAGLSAAVAWFFLRAMTPDVVAAEACPVLAGWCAAAEGLAAFRAAPHGDGTVAAP